MNMSLPALPEIPSASRLVSSAATVSGVAGLLAAFERLFGTPQQDTPTGPGFYADGVFLHVRPLTDVDSGLLHDFLQNGLSEKSRHDRFLAPEPRISESAANYLADRDGRDRVALVAVDTRGETEVIVGMVEYALIPNSDAPPEVAIAVADDFQGQGIARNLLSMLAVLSIAGGHTVWTGSVLTGNEASLATLRHVGQVQVQGYDSGVAAITITLEPAHVLTAV